jgi:hypothetical protein
MELMVYRDLTALQKGETALRGLTSTLNSGNNANIWVADSNNVNSGYPVLAGIATTSSSDPVPAGSYTIIVYRTPDKLTYNVGDTFSTDGLQIRANYIGSYQDITEYTVSPSGSLTTSDKAVTVSVTYEGIKHDFKFNITVESGTTAEAIYLNGETGNDSNNGTTTSAAVKTLAQAVSLAGTDKEIQITGTVTLNSAATYNPNVTIKRYSGFTGPMFVIDADNTSQGIAYVTMTSANIDGGGVGNVFEVNQGRLRLRGGITVTNTGAACVYVNASGSGITTAQAELNYGTFSAGSNGTVVNVAATTSSQKNDFILDNFGFRPLTINGNIYLGAGSYITANNPIPTSLTINAADTEDGSVIVAGTDSYTLSDSDLSKVSVIGVASGDLNISSNKIIIESFR